MITFRVALMSVLLCLLNSTQNMSSTVQSSRQVYVLQNEPNPFSKTQRTKIAYKVSEPNEANIVFYKSSGQVYKMKQLKETIGIITLSGSEFEIGTYYYALATRGRLIDKRKMEVLD